jgi:C4-dicarboxylate-binding protein DctP
MPQPVRPSAPPLRRRSLLGAASASLAALALARPVRAARPPLLVRFSHVVAAETPKGRMALEFQRLVAQRSAGRIRVEVHPDSQLYGDEDELEALRLGAVELIAPSLSKFGQAGLAEFEVFDLPFLFDDLEQVHRVTQGEVGRRLLDRLARQQMVGLGFMDSGFKQMSARRPLRTPAEFRGLRLRVQASRVLVAQMRALGAEPVVLPFGETRRALASGVVDGAENPLPNFTTQGLEAVQSDITLTRHGYLGYAVVSHPRFWDSLAADDRLLLRRALDEAIAFGNRLSAELDRAALERLRRQRRPRLHELDAAGRTALRQAVQPVYRNFEQRGGASLLAEVRSAIAAGMAAGH